MHVNTAITFTGDGARHIVADTEGAVSLALALTQSGQRIGRLPALTEHKHQGILGHREITVAELTGKFALGRDLREGFDQVFTHHGGMEGRAAATQDDTLYGAKLGIGHVESAQFCSGLLVGQASTQGICHTFDLLVDFLEHEMGIFTHADILVGHLDCGDIVLGPIPGDRRKSEPFPGQHGDLVVVEIDHIARMSDDGADITGKKMLSIAYAKHKRAATAGTDDQTRKFGVDYRNPVSPGH